MAPRTLKTDLFFVVLPALFLSPFRCLSMSLGFSLSFSSFLFPYLSFSCSSVFVLTLLFLLPSFGLFFFSLLFSLSPYLSLSCSLLLSPSLFPASPPCSLSLSLFLLLFLFSCFFSGPPSTIDILHPTPRQQHPATQRRHGPLGMKTVKTRKAKKANGEGQDFGQHFIQPHRRGVHSRPYLARASHRRSL
jgi:hypothetical protein